MATNPYVNKVVLGSDVLLDLTGDTATAADVAEGKTFHLASGALATGTASGGDGVEVFYGTCATAAATAAKAVVCEEFTSAHLVEGTVINVKFTNAQTYNGAPTLNVQSTGAVNIKRVGTTNAARYEWAAGEVLQFVYDGTYWVLTDGGLATTTYYGATKLTTSGISTNAATALTPASLNGIAQYMVSGAPVYSASSTYAVGDRVRYGYYTYECTTAITTAEAWNAEHWTALDPLQEQVDAKQDALVSGTNIKTVNGNSILGSGDLTIGGGGDYLPEVDPILGRNEFDTSNIYFSDDMYSGIGEYGGGSNDRVLGMSIAHNGTDTGDAVAGISAYDYNDDPYTYADINAKSNGDVAIEATGAVEVVADAVLVGATDIVLTATNYSIANPSAFLSALGLSTASGVSF